jgi:hypothetical protein
VPVLRFLIQSFVSVQSDCISVGLETKTLCYGSFVASSCHSAGSQIRNFNDDDTSSMATSVTNKGPADKETFCAVRCAPAGEMADRNVETMLKLL